MRSTLAVIPVVVVVSVLSSVVTIIVHESMSSEGSPAGMLGGGEPSVTTPQVERLSEEVATVRQQLEEAAARLEGLDTRVAGQASSVRELAARVESSPAGSGSADATAAAAGGALSDADRERLEVRAETLFDQATKAGFGVLASPKLSELAEVIAALGEDGRAFVLSQLASDEQSSRFAAAALIERLKDPAYVADLEQTALGDPDFIVRRMASHALAFLDDPAAGDSLARIVSEEKKDAGVRLNAWYGLAQLGRPEAATSFDRMLSESGGEVPADLVVDTALKVSRPDMLPVLRRAYDASSVSPAIKARVLRTLAESETREYDGLLREVAADESADEVLRNAAREALEQR